MTEDFLERPFSRRVAQSGDARVVERLEEIENDAGLAAQRGNGIVAFDIVDVRFRIRSKFAVLRPAADPSLYHCAGHCATSSFQLASGAKFVLKVWVVSKFCTM